MKKFVSVLSIFVLIINMLSFPALAYTEVVYSGYEGEYFVSIDSQRPWFGYSLKVYEITQEYISFDFQYEKPGHAVGYTADKAYFINGNTAVGYGTTFYADSSENVLGVKYEFLFSNNKINLKIYISDAADPAYNIDYSCSGTITVPESDELITVTVNGVPLVFDQQPVMKDDRVMVPIRKVFEALGADVYWDEGEWIGGEWQRITAIKNNTLVQMEQCLSGDGIWSFSKRELSQDELSLKPLNLYIQPVIINDRTLIPVRAISEALGADVYWDDKTNTVIITGDTSGNRKTDEENAAIEAFNAETAYNMIKNKYYIFQGEGAPNFDAKGKFYQFMVSSDGTSQGSIILIKVYHDGTIEKQQ